VFVAAKGHESPVSSVRARSRSQRTITSTPAGQELRRSVTKPPTYINTVTVGNFSNPSK
jgi:hypothetical protein